MPDNDKQISNLRRGAKQRMASASYPLLLLAAILVNASLILTACKPFEEKSQMNLDTGVVRIEIEGQRFDVPLRYMYGQATEIHGRWPTPKVEVSKVGALSLSVLLPDLRPYYKEDDAKWKVKGHGDRLEVAIAIPPGGLVAWHDWYGDSLKRTKQFADEGRFYQQFPNSFDLLHFAEKTGDRYFAQNSKRLAITCDKSAPPKGSEDFWSPSCKVKSNYRPGLVFEYYYALKYLPQWKEIDDGLKALFDQFAHAAQTAPTAK